MLMDKIDDWHSLHTEGQLSRRGYTWSGLPASAVTVKNSAALKKKTKQAAIAIQLAVRASKAQRSAADSLVSQQATITVQALALVAADNGEGDEVCTTALADALAAVSTLSSNLVNLATP